MSVIFLQGTPSSSHGRLPGRNGSVGSSHKDKLLSKTCCPSLLPMGEAPSRTVLPLNAVIKGRTSALAAPSGVKTTGIGLDVIFAWRFAILRCFLTVLTISFVSRIGWHELEWSPTNSISVPRI